MCRSLSPHPVQHLSAHCFPDPQQDRHYGQPIELITGLKFETWQRFEPKSIWAFASYMFVESERLRYTRLAVMHIANGRFSSLNLAARSWLDGCMKRRSPHLSYFTFQLRCSANQQLSQNVRCWNSTRLKFHPDDNPSHKACSSWFECTNSHQHM